LPAVSKHALIRMRQQVHSWNLHRRTNHNLTDLAQLINPIVRGWMQYYVDILPHRAESAPQANQCLSGAPAPKGVSTAAVLSQARACWQRIARQQPGLYAHWAWETSIWQPGRQEPHRPIGSRADPWEPGAETLPATHQVTLTPTFDRENVGEVECDVLVVLGVTGTRSVCSLARVAACRLR
jgi:hypothetical protein